jgi:S1-C subfamily serine protease
LKKHLHFVFILFLLCFVTLPCLAQALPDKEFSREKAIQDFLTTDNKDLIEGIWATENDQYELAIVKNTFSIEKGYDYLGFITQSNDSAWNPGALKLQLKTAAASKIYIGSLHEYKQNLLVFTENKLAGNTFRLTDDNTITYIQTTKNKKEIKHLYRIYPNDKKDGKNAVLKKVGSGSGFFITPNLIITNHHVIDKAKNIEIVYNNDQKIAATVLAKDPANDLAILKVDDFKGPVSPLFLGNTQNAKDGDPVYAVGFPMPTMLGDKAKLSEGIINSITGFKDDVRMYQISIPIQPGNSGSPLLNEKGQVIGVVTASMNGAATMLFTGTIPQNVNFAVKINYIQNLISTLPDGLYFPAAEPQENLTPTQIMNLAKKAVVEVQIKEK